jgi:hypothetical protein
LIATPYLARAWPVGQLSRTELLVASPTVSAARPPLGLPVTVGGTGVDADGDGGSGIDEVGAVDGVADSVLVTVTLGDAPGVVVTGPADGDRVGVWVGEAVGVGVAPPPVLPLMRNWLLATFQRVAR